MGHPEAWRRTLTAAEPGAPWVTYYQPESGARIELSRATFDNWVAKAASMLSDECDVEPGTEVLFDLQPHWLLPVWAWATWAIGATVVLPDGVLPDRVLPDRVLPDRVLPDRGLPDVEVCITDDPTVHHSAARVLLSSRHPMGLPATQAASGPDSQAHPGVIDALADIRGYPDIWTNPVPAVGEALVRDASVSLRTDDQLTQLLQARPVLRAALLRTQPQDAATFTTALLGPAFHGSSLVIVDGGSPADIDAITAQERVDVDLS